MRSLFGTLVTFCAIVLFGIYAWNHMKTVPLVAPAVVGKPHAGDRAPAFEESQDAQQAVKFAGPLATYMDKNGNWRENLSGSGDTQVETLESAPNPADHVGGSVVGSTSSILHKRFRVRSAVQLSFSVPAHAATPRLRGMYQSFTNVAGTETSDSDADVEFLVLNDEQYSEFLHGRHGDATFSLDEAHVQEVNASLPPTIDQPVKYHLVFRNNTRRRGSKLVQADFRMEF
jgi:hypothetical protein